MKNKVLVVNGSSYYKPFSKFGSIETNANILNYRPECVKLLVLTGGSDVDPAFYGEKLGSKTYSNPRRDREEKEIFDRVRELNIPVFGICRGLQFMCAMAGGKLVQHLDNHTGGLHDMLTNEGELINVNSLHHQMVLPGDVSHTILSWAVPKLSSRYMMGDDEYGESPCEYEAVCFHKINSAGVQYHPEMMSTNSSGARYATELAARLIDGEFKYETSETTHLKEKNEKS